jgi:uncharacterized protein involved in response to NO
MLRNCLAREMVFGVVSSIYRKEELFDLLSAEPVNFWTGCKTVSRRVLVACLLLCMVR